LRFIENGECQCVGDSHTHQVNVRLIVATNRNLQQQVEQGSFRADLYYRLKIVPLELPPLQQRGKDILLLVNHYMTSLAQQHGLAMPTLSHGALTKLRSYSWPGNVRELRNLCERLVVLLPGQEIEETNLSMLSEPVNTEALHRPFRLPRQGLCLESLETDLIRQALGQSGGNKSRAARLLGISRDAFLYRLKKYSI
ncbi:MAG: sigma 54-interacting transcriptional regulator, partial [Gammaproteobacteria bacterium]|nr:sigma 54-interacting transcriptional regulator [Gammaproteobacteria bacterium]